MVRMIELGWGQANPAFHQAFSTMLMPDAPSALTDELNELQRASTSPAQAARIFSAVNDFDASADIARIMASTLASHARDDAPVPLAEGRLIAAGARDARLVTLDGRNHVLVRAEPAFDQFVAEMHAFLDDGAAPTAAGFPSLNPRERDLLQLVAMRLDNAQIAARLALREGGAQQRVGAVRAPRRGEPLAGDREGARSGFGRASA